MKTIFKEYTRTALQFKGWFLLVIFGTCVMEQGTHQELLDLGGNYSKMWKHQSGEFISSASD